MAVNERRLSGRDVLAKTFQTKTKRGYDPVEVDAYLELVAAQIDMLHGDITNASVGSLGPAEAPELDGRRLAERDGLLAERDGLLAERDGLRGEVQALRTDRDRLASANAELVNGRKAMLAENEQLRTQLTAVAPPPPVIASTTDTVESGPPEELAVMPAEAAEMLPAETVDDRAVEESYELVLRMARRSAEETIAEAHARADEIVADANFTAAQISRESDRKAFEAANKVQTELASIHEDIEVRKAEVRHLDGQTGQQRAAMRELANRILAVADDTSRSIEGVSVVDLRPQDSETV